MRTATLRHEFGDAATERLSTSSQQVSTLTATYPTVAVVIPALNEQDALPCVLRALPAVGVVIVVDNGSTDQTASVARQHGAMVAMESQRGYGAACLRGIAYVDTLVDAGYRRPDVIAFVDADFSDHPDELSQLLDPIVAKQADFVLGSRLRGQRERRAMPLWSSLGNRFACLMIWLRWGQRYSDLGPMRAIGAVSLDSLDMSDRDYGWTIEMQIKAAKRNLRVIEIPVSYRVRIGTSKISGSLRGSFQASKKILSTLFRYGLMRTNRSDTGGQ